MARGGRRILFAGGGTGGHVFPGIALAQHLGPQDTSTFWLCTSRPFDAAQLSKVGIPFEALESPRWRGFRGFLGPMARALVRSVRVLRSFRPDVVVGVGGYGTVPPVVAAKALGIPYVLLEPNAVPGKANRFLAGGAARVYAQWPQARSAFPGCGDRVRVTGSPIRQGFRRIPKQEARRRFGLDDERPTVAIVGGSQGAEALNRGALAGLDGAGGSLQLIHVAGAGRAEAVRSAYEERGARASVHEFVADMDRLYSAADLVVSRAGALTLAEIAAFEVPAVVVPIARSAGDHQRANARALARAGGGIFMEEAECVAGGLAHVLRSLVSEDPMFDNMRKNLRPLARPEAAQEILGDLGEFLASR